MKIAIIGLGYVGLPLLNALSNKYHVVGYDIDPSRVNELNSLTDSTGELTKTQLKQSLKKSIITNSEKYLSDCSIFIITVPTPLKKNNQPDLSLLKNASIIISKYISKGNIVVVESTVYPGVTEGFVAKIIEKKSRFKFNKDFFCAYSPERINPGDKKKTIRKVTKVIGASTKNTLKTVSKIYSSFLNDNIHLTENIKIAEASKVIENAQRDLNIAFMNEIQNIFDKAGLNTYDVLAASKTKWNFLPFEPGLVGGHCIGIDPYYLAKFSKIYGINSKLILAGRKINENEKNLVIKKILKLKKNKKITKLLILGITFKENCPDIRNSKALEIVRKISKYKDIQVNVYDPYISLPDIIKSKKIYLYNKLPQNQDIDIIVILVRHKLFVELDIKKIQNISKNKIVLLDYKNIFRNKFEGKFNY